MKKNKYNFDKKPFRISMFVFYISRHIIILPIWLRYIFRKSVLEYYLPDIKIEKKKKIKINVFSYKID